MSKPAYEQAVKEEPRYAGIVPVGLAWNRAIDTGVADANPYDGIDAGKIDLWAYDHYHASELWLLSRSADDFGKITGQDPLSLGPKEIAADAFGFSPAETSALLQIAHDTLAAQH